MSRESEEGLVGICLKYPRKFFDFANIPPEAFTLPHTHAAWLAMLELSRKGPFDRNQVASTAEKFTAVGIIPHLQAIMDSTWTAEYGQYHAKSVTDAYTGRRMLRVLQESIEGVKSGSEPLIAFNETVSKLIELVKVDGVGAKTARQLVETQIQELVRLREGGLVGLSTGFPRMDSILSGLIPGELYCVSAFYAGGGKSSLVMQINANILAAGETTLTFSAELSERTLFFREASRRSGKTIKELFTLDHNQFVPGIEEFAVQNAYIDTTEMPSVQHIQSQSLAIGSKTTLSLIVVDMIQHIDAPGATEFERIGNAIKGLKSIAKQLSVPVICVSSVNRTRDMTGLPTTRNLYGSSWIDSLCSFVGIICPASEYYKSRRKDYEVEEEENGKVIRRVPDWANFWKTEKLEPPDKDNGRILMCLKNRHGPQWHTNFNFDGAHYRFDELDSYDAWLNRNGTRINYDERED